MRELVHIISTISWYTFLLKYATKLHKKWEWQIEYFLNKKKKYKKYNQGGILN
jgi:hypothetical protein